MIFIKIKNDIKFVELNYYETGKNKYKKNFIINIILIKNRFYYT